MGTKNISLPKELEDYVNAKVKSGEYAHSSEVVRDGIRLLMCREAEKLEWLREAIGKGLVSLEKGEAISDDGLLAEVKKKGRSLMKARQKRK